MPCAYTPELKRIMRIGKMPTFNVGPGRPLAVGYSYAARQHEDVNPAFLSLFSFCLVLLTDCVCQSSLVLKHHLTEVAGWKGFPGGNIAMTYRV